MKGCTFCNPKKEDIIFETEKYYLRKGSQHHHGHIDLVLKEHVERISELSYEKFMATTDLLYHVLKIVDEVFKPDKINVSCLGNWHPHLHINIYPRYKEDFDYAQPPLLDWKIYGERVPSPKTSLVERPMSRKEVNNLKKLLKNLKVSKKG